MIDPTAAALLMLFVGAQLSLQAPVNAGLARVAGNLPAVLISFLGGTALLAAVVAAQGQLSELGGVADVRWYYLLGGVFGALYVLTSALTVRSIGAGGVAAATITGQLIGSMGLDAAGLLGLDRQPLGPARILGALMLLAGTYLIVARRREAPPGGVPRDWRQTAVPMIAMTTVGVLIAVQHPINARLADTVEAVPAGLVNFLVGTALLAIAVIAVGSAPQLLRAARVRWVYLTGGLFGSINAVAALSVVDEIGAGAVAAATITGQLAASVALDRFEVLGLQRRELSAERLLGVALLGLGTYLVVG